MAPNIPVPGAPRTETQSYRFPPVHDFPPVDECDRDSLLEIAEANRRNAYVLSGSSGHIELICQDYLDVTAELALVDEQLRGARQQTCDAINMRAEVERQLAECRALLAEQQELRRAALEDAEQQRAIAIRLSEQVAAMIGPPIIRPAVAADAYLQWDTSDVDTVVCSVEDVK